jgi:multidrug efflux pump subunit AcrA (membrane-fusion protein)
MPYGYRFQIGIQRVTQPDPNAHHGGGRWVALIAVLALVAVALLVWPARNAPAEPAPAAHIAAAPTPTPTAKPAPTPPVVRVTGTTGAVCFLPGGKTISPVTLDVVP